MASKQTLRHTPGKCTGCRLCMLACSWVQCGAYSVHASVMQIHVDEKVFARTMTLDEERCSGCLACVSACPDGALDAGNPDAKEAV